MQQYVERKKNVPYGNPSFWNMKNTKKHFTNQNFFTKSTFKKNGFNYITAGHVVTAGY